MKNVKRKPKFSRVTGSIIINNYNQETMEEIKIPQSLAEYEMEQLTKQAFQETKEQEAKRKIMERKNMQKQRASLVKKFLKDRITYQQLQNNPASDPLYNQQVTQQFQQEYDTFVSQTRQQLQDEFGVVLHANQDVLEIEDEINDALQAIDDDRYVQLSDFEVKQSPKGDIRVTTGKDKMPMILQKLLSITRKLSNVNVNGRMLDVRQIAKLNSAMINVGIDGSLMLSPVTLSFRPKVGDEYGRNDRIMVSLTGTSETTGDLLFYMQQGRKRFVGYIKHDRFSSSEDYLLFLSNAINDFFIVGFDNIRDRMITETDDVHGLDRIGKLIQDTNNYLVQYTGDANEGTISLLVTAKNNPANQWLRAEIMKANIKGTYRVILTSQSDCNFYQEPFYNEAITIDMLQNNIVNLLRNWYSMNWNENLAERQKADTSILNKFVIVKMRAAVNCIIEMKNLSPYCGIVLNNAYSRQETSGFMPNKQMAEVLTGKTNSVDYFILTCFKNPDSGEMTFLLEYAVKGVECNMIGTDFEQILEDTKFLFEEVKTVNS